ncbi:MAG: accessory gene regulator B family protein [Christensenellales bacterium]
MMQRLAIWIVSILEKKGALRSGVSRETYIYGFDIAIYTFLSTFGLFLIGWIADRPIETALLIFLYYTNQSSGGGFHASSHLMCFLTMVLGECFSLLLSFSRIHPLPAAEFPVYHFFSCGRIRLFSIQTKAISKRKRLNSLSILVKFCWLKLPC